jgi:hypothetical protein
LCLIVKPAGGEERERERGRERDREREREREREGEGRRAKLAQAKEGRAVRDGWLMVTAHFSHTKDNRDSPACQMRLISQLLCVQNKLDIDIALYLLCINILTIRLNNSFGKLHY